MRNLACQQAAPRKRSESREIARATVSFRVLLARDFSRLPQIEILLAGYLTAVELPLATTQSAKT